MVREVPARLAEYRRKRDFTKTTEPQDSSHSAGRQLVIQQHFARRLHYDLRLEIEGVLVSWAVTKGPSANPKDKRLAVRTEDHPPSYGAFEGTIPKGQYGGGTVVLWESTTFVPLNGDPAATLAKGEIKFESMGNRLRGKWVLVRMKTHERTENWLLIKERDEFVETDDGLASRFATGILSGLTVRDIEAGKRARNVEKLNKRNVEPPEFVPPQLCELSESLPSGEGWVFELKYDGYRLMLAIGGGRCIAYTRSGLDWSAKFSTIVQAALDLPCSSALLDCEAVVLSKNGLSDFPALVTALEHGKTGEIIGIAFDMLHLDGVDIRTKPYTERKQRLHKLLGNGMSLRFGDYLDGEGEDILRTVADAGGEGLIAKKKSAPYRSGRGASWLKIKTDLRTDVDIIGYMPSEKGESFASLLGARSLPEGLVYVGRIGTGYRAKTRMTLKPLIAQTTPNQPKLVNPLKLPRKAVFLNPPFGAEVRFGGWTRDGQLRQARFISVQNDRAPNLNSPVLPKPAAPNTLPATVTWRISHPERVLFPDNKVTKADIANYYKTIWLRIQPHLANRPVSLLRVPDTIQDEVFFQRHPLKGMTKGVQLFGPLKEQYFALEGEQGVATVVQFGGVEIHGWNTVLPDLDHPDRMIFDLDPDETLPFSAVKLASVHIKNYLDAANLMSWPLLSGGKGIHVVVPLNCTNSEDDVEFFCSAFAKRIAAERSELFVATISKARRTGKILIDYLRNRKKATAIIPWSVRARPGSPIAAPVSWTTLSKFKSARAFDVINIPPIDPWTSFWTTDQAISHEVITMLKRSMDGTR